MRLEPYDIRDPARLISEIADRVDLVEDTAYAVLVRAPSTAQTIVWIRRLELPAWLDDDDDISDDLRDLAESYPLPQLHPFQHALVTVVVRPGRCLLGPNEGVWLHGWRYANHLAPVYDSDLILVTEHGWTDFMTGRAGHRPRMQNACPA